MRHSSELDAAMRARKMSLSNKIASRSAKASASFGGKNSAPSPATSLKTGISEQITGTPNDCASTTGKQNPS